MICGREVKQAVCDVRMGSLSSRFAQIRMSHFSTLSCLLGRHLCVNKSDGDYVGGNLVLQISVFLLKGLQAPLWVIK